MLRGIGIHYQQLGRGRPDIVLVHGLGANLAFWLLGVAQLLARDARVTAYDLRGHGRSDMPPSGYGVAEMVGDLELLFDALRLGPAHLVAHSFGSGVALEFAARRPEHVRSLVLADPIVSSLRGDGRSAAQTTRSLARWLGEAGVAIGEDGLGDEHRLLAQLADPERNGARSHSGDVEYFIPFGLWHGGRRSAARWRDLVATTTALDELVRDGTPTLDAVRSVAHSTLIVAGARSRHGATRQVLERTLPRVQTCVVPGAGHFHPLLKPGVFAGLVRSFLDEPQLRGAG